MTCGHCGKPTQGTTLCDKCATTAAYAIANIAAYTDDADTVRAKQARYGDPNGKASVGKTMPLPVDMRFVSGPPRLILDTRPLGGSHAAPAAQLMWDVRATLVAWCRVLMDEQARVHGPTCVACLHVTCHTARQRRWPDDTVRGMCRYLDRTHRWWESRDWAPAMLDELLDLERRLRRLVDRPPSRQYAGRCHCDAELYALEGKTTMHCQACGAEHDVASRREFLLREASDYLVTATEAASALLSWTDCDWAHAKIVDRIRRWRDRGTLDVADVTSLSGRDRHLYRLGDVQALLVVEAQRDLLRRGARATP